MNLKDREELERWIDIITQKAVDYGLDFYPTHFEVVPEHVIYELGSYSLPARFSHWTFGRDYHQQKTMYEYGMAKIYEIVFNTDPCQAFLMDSNSMLSHKFVVTHVLGHNDFFKNNVYFEQTDRSMIEKVRLHSNRIRRYEEEYGPQVVEEFLDAVLSIEYHFDTGLTTSFRRKTPEEYEADRKGPQKSATEYDDLWDLMDTKTGKGVLKPRKFPPEPDKDLLGFLRDHAPDLERWQRDILNMVREEMIYFIPQMRTKTINEGWACATADSLLVTERGLMRFDDLVNSGAKIAVGSGGRGVQNPVTDFHIERQVPTIRVTSRKGYSIEGAVEHRVLLSNGSWAFLKDVKVGDRIALAAGTEVWPQEPVANGYTAPQKQVAITEIATRAGASIRLHCPYVDPVIAALLGYIVGEGHITRFGIRLTCCDGSHAESLAALIECVFGIPASLRPAHTQTRERWRIDVHSQELLQYLSSLGIDLKAPAKSRCIPDAILRSPRPVVAAFLSGYFDADGYASTAGVTLSTACSEIARIVQILLLNFGILSSRTEQPDGSTQLGIADASIVRFASEIGFTLERKQEALERYVSERHPTQREDHTDEVIAIEEGMADVYDITVASAHTYIANGFVNHNSFWHERIMTDLDLTPEEHLEFRRLHSSVLSPGSKMSLNPYYVGYNIFRDIERRWNGMEDPDFPEENWMGEKPERPSGEGMKKIFEVRRDENDLSFQRKYLTQGLIHRLDMYTYKLEEVDDEPKWVVQDTNWRRVRDVLLESMTNFGIPVIYVIDADYARHGELLLKHAYDGKPLDLDYTARTMRHIVSIWKRPVHLETEIEDKRVLLTCDGEEFTQSDL